ncbi:RNA polymerase II-associated protein 1-like [Hetaerina americana]|uniref:RNA polymerase II-associated protein 1-like n=1 Tax=Hetaerina americana TaxID=62018 RepID=UPI003A7F5E00
MNSRPKPGESEEDLLKLEAEYLGKVINQNVKSVVAQDDGSRPKNRQPSDNIVRDQLDFVGISDDIIIQERIVDVKSGSATCEFPALIVKGFPQPFARDKMIKSSPGGRSIFAQQLKAKRENAVSREGRHDAPVPQKKHKFGERSTIQENLSGREDLVEKIHEENITKLECLSEDEIRQQQKVLLSQLNPQLIEVLRKRRTQERVSGAGSATGSFPAIEEAGEQKEEPMSVDDDDGAIVGRGKGKVSVCESAQLKGGEEVKGDGPMDDQPLSSGSDKETTDGALEVEIPKELEEGIDKHRWLHMDVKEAEKLTWIGEIPKPMPVQPGVGHVARFDFEGVILPYDADIPVTKALHHHGSEPGRPGYTLDELLILSRSSVAQQRTLALTTLAAILKTAKQGYYDSCLDEPLLPLLVERDILTLFRFSLDENSHLVLLPAALAISQLIVDEPDEVCLDLLLGLPRSFEQPCLAPKSPPKTDHETKDNILARGDLVKGALQMDLLPRIR